MGFLDGLKNAAKGAVFQALNIEMEEEKVAKPKATETYGTIEGSNLPEGARYGLDKTNQLLMIREFKTNRLICQYSFDDVKSFKLAKITEKDVPFGKISFYHFTLILNNGTEFELCESLTDYNEKTEFNVTRAAEASYKFFDVIHAFILNVKDKETKKWLNTLFEDVGELPVFDESGGYLADNIVANYETHLQK